MGLTRPRWVPYDTHARSLRENTRSKCLVVYIKCLVVNGRSLVINGQRLNTIRSTCDRRHVPSASRSWPILRPGLTSPNRGIRRRKGRDLAVLRDCPVQDNDTRVAKALSHRDGLGILPSVQQHFWVTTLRREMSQVVDGERGLVRPGHVGAGERIDVEGD